jgi:homoserine O-acetyltransferase
MADAITSDLAFDGGNYRQSSDVAVGLRRHAKLWAVMGWSTEFYQQGRPAALGFPTVESFVENFMCGYFAPMDPNDLLCMAWKCRHSDVSRLSDGNVAEALGRIQAKTFVMPVDEDMFFKTRDCEAEQKLIRGSEFRPLHSIDGHLALFGTDPGFLAQVDEHLSELLMIRA